MSEALSSPVRPVSPPAPARILVVDDERFFREAIREILAEEGLECVEVESGEQALSLALEESVGVVVLDIRLPGMDGIEVLRRLRELRPELRVVMLSASTDQDLVLEALRLGACDYLAKPLHDEELRLTVRRAAEGFGVAHGWSHLRSGLDRLVGASEELAAAARAEGDGLAALERSAVETAARVLRAGKTSLLLHDPEADVLRVAAVHGREIGPEAMSSSGPGQGVAGAVFASGEPVAVEDAARAGAAAPEGRYEGASYAVAPVPGGGRTLGVLCATDREGGGVFGEEDLALLRLLALQVGELRAGGAPAGRVREAGAGDPDSTLSGLEPSAAAGGDAPAAPVAGDRDGDAELARVVCEAMVSEVEPERVVAAVLEAVGRRLRAAPVSLYLLDGVSGELRLEGEWDGAVRSDRPMLPRDRGLTGGVLQTGLPVAADEPWSDARFDPDADTPRDGRAAGLLCVPLCLRGKPVGVARAFLPEGAPADARTAEVLGAALSAAARNVLLYRSLLESIEEVAEARRQAGAPR